ncbi:MAG: hypothetical protein BAA01_00975 [Bacillus thermozeamaize]|uniref:ATP-grasp domain-containing protein n=1 Tax=Bacillus thermozeamaize TaxID=230954 RepID=A0A1Y3PAR5_9BACI|nr:MAG: hypothetical protein BAA01_00975 [Bacillus thermozeamaize]
MTNDSDRFDRNKFNSKFRFVELNQASHQTGIPLYYFSDNDINFKNLTVRGTYYNKLKMTWERKTFPLPDVLYDRCGSVRWHTQEIRKLFSKLGIPSINAQNYFDKWDIHLNLLEMEETRAHLPMTIRYCCQDDLKAFIMMYGKVYIKSVNGRRGKKVMRVTRIPNRGYQYSYYVNGLVVGTVRRFQDFIKTARPFFHDNDHVIIQQAIPLMQIGDRSVDFRAEVQRNGQGELEIVGICARIGHPNSPITTHSEAYRFEEFFQDHLNYSEEKTVRLRKKVEDFLLNVYDCMEKNYGPFGEIGIDFGLDEHEKIWFIECNAKSAKVSLKKAYDDKTLQRAFINPLEYARYIYNYE